MDILARETDSVPMFEVAIAKRGRSSWEWRVCDRSGKVMMRGRENSRVAARYRGERALFQLLLTQKPDLRPLPRCGGKVIPGDGSPEGGN